MCVLVLHLRGDFVRSRWMALRGPEGWLDSRTLVGLLVELLLGPLVELASWHSVSSPCRRRHCSLLGPPAGGGDDDDDDDKGLRGFYLPTAHISFLKGHRAHT